VSLKCSLMRKDLTAAQVADALFVLRSSVRTHVSVIMRKLRATDRAAAVRSVEHRES
jgi:DNA-binding NarL/FixJ family response regulator